MDPINDARFYESLIKLPHQRNAEDIRNIYDQLRHLDMFQNLYNDPLKAICRLARYERHPAHQILFREGQVATCWYILLSGSVFIADHIYLPYGCFGKRNVLNSRRPHDCLCLQESEMIVIDYPPDLAPNQQKASSSPSVRRSVDVEATLMPPPPVPPRPPRMPAPRNKPAPPPRGLPRSYMVEFPVDVPSTSYESPSENYKSQVFLNGSTADEDTLVRVKHRREKSNSMGSVASAAIRKLRVRSTASSTTTEGEELGGEGVDSEEEDDEGSCPSRESFMDLRDSVRECLEKEPSERNSEDLAVLLDFMQHMSAFAPLPMSIKRQLCLKMVFAVVNDAGTIVMHHNEKLDAWSVLVNGVVEVVKPSGERIEYKLGDSFGAEPTPTVQHHVGEMKTLVDDCEFVLVEHKDFCSIMSTVQDHIERDMDGVTGEVTAEHERRSLGSQSGAVIIKAKADRLIQHLVEERDNTLDPHYVDDFLLTYRVFIQDPTLIFEKLMLLFADNMYRDKVARLILLWVNNHYNDFETNDDMFKLLERFEAALEREGMHSQQSLLNIACSVKSRIRRIEFTRQAKDARLQFLLVGGKEESSGIFVSSVEAGSEAERVGLRRADEIMEIGGQSVRGMTLARAEDLIRGTLTVNLSLKSNILGFKELQEKTDTLKAKKSLPNLSQGRNSVTAVIPVRKITKNGTKPGMMDKLMTILSSSKDEDFTDEIRTTSHEIRPSRSNPDISSISQYYNPVKSDSPEHVLKIYRSDQTFKYLAVYKETTAQNVVQLALQEFNMTAEGSLEWSLCECSVTDNGVIKQKRLPHQLENLAERISLNSRYYLKNINKSEPLVPDELAPEILKEAQAQLLLLNAQVVAAQLTLQDFAVFTSIEPTEYIDNLFQLNSGYGSPKLEEFENVFNREMWWVATEICRERNVQKRAKLIKKFIKIARYCRDLRNFNSMFAIMSGLDKPAVRRLHSTWERVSGKYIRMLDDVQQLVDPSRNMSKYRQHLAEVSQEPPVIPIYPVIKKDLTFSHEGNPTYMDKLVNFEKLRLIAKSVRAVTKLSSAPYEISSMAEKSGGIVNDALLHMNSFENGNVATMRKGGKLSQPRKKIYEQALMVRKVKTYLEGLKTIDNELELDKMSYELEPQQSTTRPRRAASPTPSSVSSQSTGSTSTDQRRFIGAKFGVESPQAVQKMFSLVSSSRVKGSISSPVSTPTTVRGLQRNVPRVTARQQAAPSIQRTPSLKNEPVDLNQETSSVTSFYGKDLRVPSVNVSFSSPSSSSHSSTFSIRSAQQLGQTPPTGVRHGAGAGVVLGHRPVPHYSSSSRPFLRGASIVSIQEGGPLSSEQISRTSLVPESVMFVSMASRAISRINPQNTALFVCDLQDKFRPTIKYFNEIVTTSKRLIDAARILGMKTVVTEQYPKGLGHTVSELGIDSNIPVFDKTKFSMCVPPVEPYLKEVKNVLLVGIEAHVCVLQTTYDLLEKGLNVHVVVDAVSSRSLTDRKFAFKQLEKAGAVLTTSECAILALLGGSDHPNFKEVQKLIMSSAPDVGLVPIPAKL